MELRTIRDLLVTTGPEEWHQPTPPHPTYRDHLAALVDDGPIAGHYDTAVYRQDVRLTLAWGMDPPGDNNPMEGAWAEWANFPDPHVTSFLVDVFYCGALVDRHVGAAVDGGRAYLPFPKPHGFADIGEYGGSQPPPIGWSVTPWQVDVFRLVNEFRGGGTDYESYVQRAGFVVGTDE